MENRDKSKPVPYGVRKESDEIAPSKHKLAVKIGRPVEWTDELIEQERLALEEWLDDPKNYYFDGFLILRRLSREHIARFEARSQTFRDTTSRARAIQEQRIVNNSLDRKFDGNFAKFVLANRHGWKEKTEVSGDAANPLNFVLGNIDGKSKDIIDITDDNKD